MSVLSSDSMLITMPEHDLATKYASEWSESVIEIAERNGIKPTVLRGKSVTRNKVQHAIQTKNPSFIAFNGHGSEDTIAGHDFEPLIVYGENDSLLKGRILHVFTCGSGKVLGLSCGAKAFIGYNDWFFLCMDAHSTNRPLEDKLAAPIMECATEAPKQIAKKKTAKEAFDKSQEKYQKWIDEYTISSSKYTTQELQLILPCLMWNKNCQVLYGDHNARLE